MNPLPLLLAGVALAGEDAIQVTVTVDDRRHEILERPILLLEQEGVAPVPLTDDGSAPADVAADGIWGALVEARKAETLTFGITDGDRRLGTFNVSLPDADSVAFTLRAGAGTPALVIDMGAEIPKVVRTPEIPVQQVEVERVPVEKVGIPKARSDTGRAGSTVQTPLVVAAVPDGQTGPAEGAAGAQDTGLPNSGENTSGETVRLHVRLDDRAVQRLSEPMLLPIQEGATAVAALDDGSDPDETADDHIWNASLEVGRSPYLELGVTDGDEDLGRITVFLPASGSADLGLRTREGTPALAHSPQASARTPTATVGGGLDVSAPSTSSAPGASCDRFSAVLWVAMGMFAVIFAYVRAVIRRLWVDEVRPFMRRIESHLEDR